MSHNQFQFIGNLTRDAKVSRTGNSPRALIDIAVDRVWRSGDGEKQVQTDFFRIKAFGAVADNAGLYLGSGSKVFVQGRIEPTRYEKPDTTTVHGFDFIAEKIEYLVTVAPGGQ